MEENEEATQRLEELSGLFFELASENRLLMLRELKKNNLRTQEIATRTKVTATEAVRQLQRLADSGLIRRDSDGAYFLTEYGKTMMHLLNSFDFVFKHKSYFSTHDLWQIPPQFVSRIGELSKCSLSMDTMESLDRGQRIILDAKEFVWAAGEGHVPELAAPAVIERVRRGLELKLIVPQTFKTEDSPARNVELRGVLVVPAVMVVSEKEAAICFRFIEGRVDYAGFFGKNESARKWVKDLFLYFWERGTRRPVQSADT